MLGWLFRQSPVVPDHLTVKDVIYFLDGGTTVVVGSDERGNEHQVALGQHLFENRGWFSRGVGWLDIDGYRVPRRSELEAAVVRLLRASLEELRSRPKVLQPEGPRVAETPDRRRRVIFGSPELAQLSAMNPTEQNIHHIEAVLAYVESDDYGKVTR